jgi:hypothetical protein
MFAAPDLCHLAMLAASIVCAYCREITFTRLYLEKPYRRIYGNAQRPACLFVFFKRELREGYAFSRADFLVDTGRISNRRRMRECASYP